MPALLTWNGRPPLGRASAVVRVLAAAVLPPIVALLLRVAFGTTFAPFTWILFYPAVYLSSLFGGAVAGLTATSLSTVLVAHYLLGPGPALGIEPRYLWSLGIFLATGVLFSVFHERLRRARRAEQAALATARATNHALQEALDQRALIQRGVDNVSAMLAYWDASGRCRFANRAYERWFGVTPETLIGKHIRELLGEALYALNRPHIERALRGEPQEFEREIPLPGGGGARQSLASYIPDVRDGAVRGFFALVTDVSEIKRAERALRESEEKFSGIVSLSSDAIVTADEAGRVVVFNAGAERIFGYPGAEAIGMPLERLVPQPPRALGGPRAVTGLRRDGAPFPAEASMSELQLGGATLRTLVLRDVTERERRERELRFIAEAGAVLAGSLDYEHTLAVVAQLAVRDFADWCVVELFDQAGRPRRIKVSSADPGRAAFCALLEGLPTDPARPRMIGSAIATGQPLLIERVAPRHLQASAQGPEHLRALVELDPRSVIAVPLKMHDALLGVIVFVSSHEDRIFGEGDLRLATALADRSALAIENARLYHAALEASRMRDEVLGIVAHDLRNPLNAIQLQAQLLRPRAQGPERRARRPGDAIQQAAARMNRLIQDMLDVTRMDAGRLSVDPGATAVPALLDECLEAQRPLAAAAQVELTLELTGEVPAVWADRDRLLQIFENLIGNGVKFTAAGGRVTIGAAAREDEVVFWVADTGPGIPPDDVPHLFDRFWQAARKGRQGAGLGLSIVKGIVEAHGGRVWVDSTPGRGTSFYFSIPVEPRAGLGPGQEVAGRAPARAHEGRPA